MGKYSFLEGDDYLVEDIVLDANAAAEGRQWINSNFTVTPVQGAALVLAIAALIGVGFATLYVAQFSFQGEQGAVALPRARAAAFSDIFAASP